MSNRKRNHVGHKITSLEFERCSEGTMLINLMNNKVYIYCCLCSIEGVPLLKEKETGKVSHWLESDIFNIFALAL